jgi:uroporphyrinogen-III synthase
MGALDGMRIAVLEARMPDALAALVRRHGGEVCCVPALREEPRTSAAEVGRWLDRLGTEPSPVIILSTGVGVARLFGGARALEREGELRELLRRATTVCRGPKPTAALQREGIEASVRVSEPYTTAELVDALSPLELRGRLVAIVHYGERNVPLVDALARRGATLQELILYEWKLPEDKGPLRTLVGDIVEGRVGAVIFTSQVQARHLFQIAAETGRGGALRAALSQRTVVAAVGPTCASALAALGVEPQVVPSHPKMGPLITALAEYVDERRK